jgi:hypothetical protein
MPYITQERRDKYVAVVEEMWKYNIETPGDLAFLITQLLDVYVAEIPLTWSHISNAHKALEAARISFEQDVYIPYEKQKKIQNGRVFTETTDGSGRIRE